VPRAFLRILARIGCRNNLLAKSGLNDEDLEFMPVDDLLIIGFNSRIVALRKQNGQMVWSWKSPKGSGYVAILFEANRLWVSVDGYTYGLDALTGAELWRNELRGMGTGVVCLATTGGSTSAFSGPGEEKRKAQSHASDSSAAS
jgi:outer membrane protein assembly factor BamB